MFIATQSKKMKEGEECSERTFLAFYLIALIDGSMNMSCLTARVKGDGV